MENQNLNGEQSILEHKECHCDNCRHESIVNSMNKDTRYRSFVATVYDEKLPDMDDEVHRKLFAWIVYQQETCPTTGRKHWQLAGTPRNQIKFSRLRELLGVKVWVDKMRGSHAQCKAYCSKTDTAIAGSFREFGKMPEPGVMVEFRLAIAEVLAGKRKAISYIEENPQLYHVYGRTLEAAELQHHKKSKPSKVLAKENLNLMQKYVLELALKPSEDRLVHWIVDEKGGSGKSAMIRYLIVNHNATLLGLSYKDSAEAYDKQPIVCFDIERQTKEEYIQYGLFEALKNGMIFSGKYHGVTKIFDPPHVIVFANRRPDESQLSQDRWRIVDTQNIVYNEMKDDLPPIPHHLEELEFPPPIPMERQSGYYWPSNIGLVRTNAMTDEERNRLQREAIEID